MPVRAMINPIAASTTAGSSNSHFIGIKGREGKGQAKDIGTRFGESCPHVPLTFFGGFLVVLSIEFGLFDLFDN